MNRAGQVIQTFRERFVQRSDVYALQQCTGKYLPVHQEVTDEVIRSHLKGEITIGLYPYADSTTTWICIDVDTREPDEIGRVRSRLNTHGIPHLLEFSGNKGFHFWVFLDSPCQNWISRTFAKKFSDGHEIFPKQDQIARGGLGNLIKAPLGKHRLTGDWCLFVNEELSDLDNPYEVLKEVPTIDVEGFLQKEFPEAFGKPETGQASTHVNRPDPGPFDRVPLAKDCVQRALIEGSDKGRRNATAIILATELRNRGVNQEGVERVLKWVWNPHNRPPLSHEEISRVAKSAFQNPNREYGCKPEGSLRQTITCLGYENCAYYSLLRALKTGEVGKEDTAVKKSHKKPTATTKTEEGKKMKDPTAQENVKIKRFSHQEGIPSETLSKKTQNRNDICDCGAPLQHSGGCAYCPVCGESSCG